MPRNQYHSIRNGKSTLNLFNISLLCFAFAVLSLFPLSQGEADATYTTDTTSFVSVDEIWNAEKGHFDGENLDLLLQYITNNSSLTTSAVTAPGSINMTKTSADIRSNTVNGKTTSQDVQVTFGGLTWQVVYLTKDKQGNDIVTLWLSNNKQEAWAGRATDEGAYYGFVNGALYSDWSADWYSSSTSVSYPSNMYGTSYINAVTLNNGGTYATSTSAATTATQSSSSVFAMFTMDDVAGSVTKYLVKPNQVGYQEDENNVEQLGTGWSRSSYWVKNDAYGTITGSGGWYSSSHDYTGKTGYTNWANSYIWLPSVTETGTSSTYIGIWNTSQSQRASNTGNDSSTNMGTVGSSSGTAYNYSWLRSGSNLHAYYAYILTASGLTSYYNTVTDSNAVRPALHLNLNSAASDAFYPTIWDGSSTEAPTLQDPSAANSETNPYIIDTAAKLAYLSENFSWAANKYFLQTENLDLNNHPWTPINNSGTGRAYYYDGGGHTISNLYINTAEQTLSSNDRIGLFGLVYGSSSKSAYIKNLGVVGGSVSGNNNVGAVVGYAYYTDITSCYNEGVSVTGNQYVGGVAGYNNNGTISSSYNEGTVTGTGNSGGGVVGYNRGTISNSYNEGAVTGSGSNVGGVVGNNESRGTISNSYNTGDVTGETQVGGVVGQNYGTISNSYNTGVVTGTGNYVGGVAGRNEGGTISNSYNTGTVTGSSFVGGVVGLNTGTISNSYNTGDVTGTSHVGGVVGYNWGGIISSSYNTGDVTGSSNSVGGVVGLNTGTISSSYNTGDVTGDYEVGGVVGNVQGSSSSRSVISSCYSTGEIISSSGSSTYFGGVFGRVAKSQYVSISWCYYNKETSGSVVTKAIGSGTGYQCYGLTTTEMQGTQNENWMYLSSTYWNFADGQYPTLKYVAKPAQN